MRTSYFKAFLLGFFLQTCTALPAFAQDAEARDVRNTDVISVNLLDAVDGFFNLAWEHAMSDAFSIYLGTEVLAFRGVFDNYDGSVIALGQTLGLNIYVLGDAPQGLFLGPLVIGSWVRASDDDSTRDRFGYAVGLRVGGAITVGHFYFGGSIGGLWRDFSVDIGNESYGPHGFRPRFDLSIGVAF